VERVKATGRTVTGLTWADIERFAAGGATATVLARLRAAGLEGLTTLPLDTTDVNGIVGQLADNGFTNIRFTVDKAPATDRVALFMSADALQDRFGCIRALNPLPMTLSAFKPTTGYDDVKMVALARLAAPGIPTIQVDWRRYGPRLAQVALSFGADDIDGVSGTDEAPEGRRRGPLEEIRRNIEAAGFQPVERDGRFIPLG
jgi:aminodeoxyfutalosine synthase